MLAADCVFCDIVAGQAPATVVHNWGLALAVVPLNPVTPGHLLLIPKTHVRDYTERPAVSAMLMHRAAEIAPESSNLITSAGPAATQTVFHLHLHVVPRRPGDGLALPWDPGVATNSSVVGEMTWTGDNAAEMRVWAGVPFLEPAHGRPAMVSIQSPDGTYGWLPVQAGDVVVKSDPPQRFAVMGSDPFPTRCAPVFTVRSRQPPPA